MSLKIRDITPTKDNEMEQGIQPNGNQVYAVVYRGLVGFPKLRVFGGPNTKDSSTLGYLKGDPLQGIYHLGFTPGNMGAPL